MNGYSQYRRLTEFGPPMWQTEADTELTLSASPATAVGQILLTMAKFCYNTVIAQCFLVFLKRLKCISKVYQFLAFNGK